MWSAVARQLTLETDPQGATVFRKDYLSKDAAWQELGVTPLHVKRFPLGISRLRFELEGYLPRETANSSSRIANAGVFVLDTPQTMPKGMARVSGGSTTIQAPGLEQSEALELRDFFMDIHEVTNRQYQAFVDAYSTNQLISETPDWLDPQQSRRRQRPTTSSPIHDSLPLRP
jgi:formylglycine-generating enzyme required for sulfatase activity